MFILWAFDHTLKGLDEHSEIIWFLREILLEILDDIIQILCCLLRSLYKGWVKILFFKSILVTWEAGFLCVFLKGDLLFLLLVDRVDESGGIRQEFDMFWAIVDAGRPQ